MLETITASPTKIRQSDPGAVSVSLKVFPAARSAEEASSVGAGYLLEHGAGELLDAGWQWDVAGGGGVGLAGVGEPVDEADQCFSGGLASLAGVDEGSAASRRWGSCWVRAD